MAKFANLVNWDMVAPSFSGSGGDSLFFRTPVESEPARDVEVEDLQEKTYNTTSFAFHSTQHIQV